MKFLITLLITIIVSVITSVCTVLYLEHRAGFDSVRESLFEFIPGTQTESEQTNQEETPEEQPSSEITPQ
jgi:hypothetical protein